MNLLIDIGNENAKWKLGDQCGSFPSLCSDLARNLDLQLSDLKGVGGVYFVNVADRECANELRAYSSRRWQVPVTQIVSAPEQCGVRNSYRNFEELGADRWVSLIGARSIHSGAVIIVDCGTAITVDALSADGEFVGGSILPGSSLSQKSLWQCAPGIREFRDLAPKLPARSTVEAVSSGVVHAIAGGVDLLIKGYSQYVGGTPKLLLTGGGSSLIAEYSSYEFEEVPNLALIGLEVIANST